MRLTDQEVAAIKAAAREAFGDDAVVRLFGSRVRDDLKGGDIDLHVENPGETTGVTTTGLFRSRLFRRIAERKVDVVVQSRGAADRPIDMVARAEGVVL
jgi:predicted nucleotidyltransferase